MIVQRAVGDPKYRERLKAAPEKVLCESGLAKGPAEDVQREIVVDGIGLATDVYLPGGPGPFPTILVRTPYHRRGLQAQAQPFVERGYAFVAQDCRGKYDSDGCFTPLVDEAADGEAPVWHGATRACTDSL